MKKRKIKEVDEILELRSALEKSRITVEKYKNIVENADVGIFQTTPSGQYITVNKVHASMLGYDSPEELMDVVKDIPRQLYVNPENREILFRKVRQEGHVEGFEAQLYRKDGQTLWISLHLHAILDEKGKPLYYEGMSIDVTDRKKAEQMVQNQNKFLGTVIESLDHPFYVINVKDYTIALSNSSTPTGEPGVNPTCFHLTHQRSSPCTGEDDPCPVEIVKRTKHSTIVEHTHYNKNGEPRIAEVHCHPVFNEHGEIIQCIEFSLDITSRKKKEEELRSLNTELTERTVELDAFAHTVAHDLKNPLGRILGYAEMLDQMTNDEQTVFSSNILFSSRKMNIIINELLLLSTVRKGEVEMEAIEMQTIVSDTIQRLEEMILHKKVRIDLPHSWPPVYGYTSWIEEVWINYLSNAIKYGGEVPHITLGYDMQDYKQVRFWVSDKGSGISTQDQITLFAPFTRFAQIGTEGHGLGLSIVRRIIEKLGGQVGVESSGIQGEGSLFYFTLPAI